MSSNFIGRGLRFLTLGQPFTPSLSDQERCMGDPTGRENSTQGTSGKKERYIGWGVEKGAW